MTEWLTVVVLGIIEGITEFLPISSTGHLLLAETWLPVRQTDTFLVVIQSGAVAAVLMIFQERLRQLVFGLRDPVARDYALKLFAAFVVTAAGGLVMKTLDFELPETATPVALALIIGGVLFIAVEGSLKGKGGAATVSWAMALAMGAAQLVAAVFPGTSRSGATILIALMMGLARPVAIEFSFLLGVPTLMAAGGLKLAGDYNDPAVARPDWGLLLLGMAVSAITAFAAVKWMLRYLETHTFAGFGWYRIALGVAVIALAVLGS